MKIKAYNLVNSVVQEELDAGLLAESYEVTVKDGKNISLPDVFDSEIRQDLVKSAVHASRANRRQPYGHREHDGKRAPQPGMKHSVEWWGKGRGVSRIMRKTGQRTAAQNPHTRGGRRAHGPMVAKDWSQKLNSKQKLLARNSAISASMDKSIVSARGHKFSDETRFPIIIGDYMESRNGSDEKYDLESSIDWNIAIVKKITKFSAEIETKDRTKGLIEFQDISWTKKEFNELLKKGDVIYVKHIKENKYSLKQIPKINGGIVVMDPYTGRVLALSGGFSFKTSEFNRVSQALRQPGSAFKPFVYALALENNYTPSSLVLDAPLVLAQGSDLKMWKPENYGKKFYGPSTLRIGLEKSRNLMTVRIAQSLGVDKVASFSKDLGIYENPEELLSISLGSAETTLMKLTSAYSAFINGGKLVLPILIDRVQDSEGNTILNNENRTCANCDQISFTGKDYPYIKNNYKQIFSPQTAYQITSLLEGAVKRGTGKKLKNLNLNLAGKTGTTNKNTDAWFIGFTSNLVVGVYVGMDNPQPLGKFETGSKTALPVFKNFIKKAIKKSEARPFKVADGITMMVVDPLTGQKAKFSSKDTILEAYKSSNVIDGVILYSNNNRLDTNNILKFY